MTMKAHPILIRWKEATEFFFKLIMELYQSTGAWPLRLKLTLPRVCLAVSPD